MILWNCLFYAPNQNKRTSFAILNKKSYYFFLIKDSLFDLHPYYYNLRKNAKEDPASSW